MGKPDSNSGSHAGYHQFQTDGKGYYGSFEVFWVAIGTIDNWNEDLDEGSDSKYEVGWYWWACFPGCLPDGDPLGPFDTSKEAWEDANE